MIEHIYFILNISAELFEKLALTLSAHAAVISRYLRRPALG
jgi:hypothetical protein